MYDLEKLSADYRRYRELEDASSLLGVQSAASDCEAICIALWRIVEALERTP